MDRLECGFCGDPIGEMEAYRNVDVASRPQPMHDAPLHCALKYELSMLAGKFESAMRKGTIERPAAPVSRVEFNKQFSGELLTLLQKWDRNAIAQGTYETVRAMAANASAAGEASIVRAFGSTAEMNEAAYSAEVDQRAASEELERAVMMASDALYDAVFGKEAE
jgi:hypothetical protein